MLTGFDLDRGTEVTVDHPSRRIRITLPPPAVMGVEITELKTYDEQRGLWNPFRPADRDTIFALARRQLVPAAGEVELARHAEESARRLLEATVRADGYTTEVEFGSARGRPPTASAEGESRCWRTSSGTGAAPGCAAAAYEAAPARFHAALGAAPPPGFLRLALAGARAARPGRRAAAEAYEDWYLLEGSAALDPLNDGGGHRLAPGAPRCRRRRRRRAARPDSTRSAWARRAAPPGTATWFAKPAGMSYGALFATLEPLVRAQEGALWCRQMTLGPALEFCLHTSRPTRLPAGFAPLALECRPVWPG